MAKQTINIGASANDRSGDPLRTAFGKINANFTELYARAENTDSQTLSIVGDTLSISGGNSVTLPSGASIGDVRFAGTVIAADTDSSLYIGTVTTADDHNLITLGQKSIDLVVSNYTSNNSARVKIDNSTANPVAQIVVSDVSSAKTWTFDDSGNLSLPNNAKILSSGPDSFAIYANPNAETVIGMTSQQGNEYVTLGTSAGLWQFGASGTLTTPLLLPKTFTAVLDTAHMVTPVALTDTPWEFVVEFQVGPDGSVQTMIGNNTPWFTNPGYVDGYTFTYTEADHGIPGFTFTLEMYDVINPGGAGWTTNLAASFPPIYPATVASLGAIKLAADQSTLTFGTDGSLTFASTDGNARFRIPQQLYLDSAIVWEGGAGTVMNNVLDEYFVIATNNNIGTPHYWKFGHDGNLKLPVGGDIQDSNGVSVLGTSSTLSTTTPTPGTASVGAATSIIVTNGPNPNWGSMGVVTNGINFTFTVDVDGNATVSAINDGGTGHWVGETFTLIGSVIGGTTPADDATLQVTAVDTANYTALDLTKSVQKLGNGYYTMGNGVEGQLMRFVRTTGATGLIRIYVTNKCRIGGNEYTNNFIDLAVDDIVTFLFTDNAWQAVGGLWD